MTGSEQQVLLDRIMRRQARLGITVALGFIVMLIVLPLVNLYLPSLAATKIGGFTLTWLALGVLFYPLTWILSGWFVRHSDHIEEEFLSSANAPDGAGSDLSAGAGASE